LKSELKAIPDFVRKAKSAELNKIIDFLTIIEKYSQENSIPFDYVLVSAKQFNTGFNKDEFKSIKVRFSNNDIKTLESVVYLFSAQRPNDNFFYLFLEKDSKDKVDVSKLTFKIVDYILHEHNK